MLAVNRVRAALEVNRRSGYRAYGSWFLAHLGRLEAGRGALDVALEHGRRAVELADGTGHPWWEATTRILLGATLLDAGDAVAARPLLREAWATGMAGGAARRCLNAALLAEASGEPAMAATAHRLLEQVHAPAGSAWLQGVDAYLALARAWLALGEPDRAGQVVAPMLAAAERIGWVPGVAEARRLAGHALA